MKFRPHREMLSESMAEVVDLEPTMEAVRHRIEATHTLLPKGFELRIHPYGFDDRIGWDTHIVSIPGYGVVGWTDGMPES